MPQLVTVAAVRMAARIRQGFNPYGIHIERDFVAAKKKIVIEIKTDAGKKARRAARAVVGIVKPARVVDERQSENRKPKHKKGPSEED